MNIESLPFVTSGKLYIAFQPSIHPVVWKEMMKSVQPKQIAHPPSGSLVNILKLADLSGLYKQLVYVKVPSGIVLLLTNQESGEEKCIAEIMELVSDIEQPKLHSFKEEFKSINDAEPREGLAGGAPKTDDYKITLDPPILGFGVNSRMGEPAPYCTDPRKRGMTW